jgi:hypothetical protein
MAIVMDNKSKNRKIIWDKPEVFKWRSLGVNGRDQKEGEGKGRREKG